MTIRRMVSLSLILSKTFLFNHNADVVVTRVIINLMAHATGKLVTNSLSNHEGFIDG